MLTPTKRLNDSLENAAISIHDQKLALHRRNISESVINEAIDKMIAEKIPKLINFNSLELEKAGVSVGKEINNLNDKRLRAASANGQPLSETELYDLSIYQIIHTLVENAIQARKDAISKKGDHPIIPQHVEHHIFSVDKPKEKTLQKMRRPANDSIKKGIIIENRNGGFKQVYYKNGNGTFLTEYDHRVLSSISKLCLEKGGNKEFTAELSEIAESMRIAMPGGGDYRSIRNSLEDIYETSLVFEDSIDPDSDHESSTAYLRLITMMKKHGRGDKFHSITIMFQDYIHKALLNGEFFSINMYLLNDLSLGTAKSLYKFIMNEFRKEARSKYTFDFEQLRAHIDIDRANANRAYQSIKKGFSQLVEYRIIQSFEDIKVGVGQRLFYVTPNELQLAYSKSSQILPSPLDGEIQ